MIKKTDWNIKVENNSISFKDRLFLSRELTEEDINLSISNVHDYMEINDIDVAIFEISSAVRNKKRILIIGDYDVDGIMSTTEFVKFFELINYPVSYYIPDRLNEGYGISDSIANRIIKEKKCDLVITVDNGIKANKQIEKLMNAGIRVVVTDHHQCGDTLPNASAVIDLHRKDNTYPFPHLCGAGVVLKVIQALSDEFGLSEDTWKDFIEYATIATIADVMPLIDENRIIVKEGIELIKRTKKSSILNLLRVSGKLENINSLCASDIAFYIGPLLNASSRIGSVETAMELLLSDSEENIIKLADKLKELNEKRKEIEANIFKEANMFLIKNYDFTSFNPIIVYGDGWHKGVIGIVASKLVEMYSKPTIILSKDENGFYHGSCRTYGDINILDMLDYCKDCFEKYGGHEGAAGLTLKEDKLFDFIEYSNKYAGNKFSQEMFLPLLNSDMVVNFNEITLDNYKYINTFAPFGMGNPDPVFVIKNAKVISLRKIGQKEGFENVHLKITVSENTPNLSKKTIDGVGFFKSSFVDIIKNNDIVDIMFKPSINEWQGVESPQMMIQDIHAEIYQKEGVSSEEDILFKEDGIEISELAEEYMLNIDEYIPSKEECFYVFKSLCALISRENNNVLIGDLDILSLIVSTMMKGNYISPFKLARIIEINKEAGYFYYKKMMFNKIILALTDGQNIRKVSETDTYKTLEEERKLFNDKLIY